MSSNKKPQDGSGRFAYDGLDRIIDECSLGGSHADASACDENDEREEKQPKCGVQRALWATKLGLSGRDGLESAPGGSPISQRPEGTPI